jgi:hypothetical protein
LQSLAPRPQATPAARRPGVLIVSHERSGTHFLINALGNAYGYGSRDFLDFDQNSLNINYFHPQAVAHTLSTAASRLIPPIVKSHHSVEFFDGILDGVLKQLTVFYIHRHPVDVMISYWRMIYAWPWHEGPRTPTAVAFAAAEPEGMMMRYQRKQARNLLHRWASHVDGWTAAAATRPRITVVRYDQMLSEYEKTVGAFSKVLGPRSGSLVPPDRNQNVIKGVAPHLLPEPDRKALEQLALSEVGETMRRLGYA